MKNSRIKHQVIIRVVADAIVSFVVDTAVLRVQVWVTRKRIKKLILQDLRKCRMTY